jgi:hypothetical protein
MKRHGLFLGFAILVVGAAFVLAQCRTEAEDGVAPVAGNPSNQPVLRAGVSPVKVEANKDATNNTTKVVFFKGAAGLALDMDDFAVTGGGAIDSVTVTGDVVTIIVTFKPNTSPSAKIYDVVIASTSERVRGDSVTITHLGEFGSDDSRFYLYQGSNVEAPSEAETQDVLFFSEDELVFDLTPADFTVLEGDNMVSKVSKVSKVSVTANVAANMMSNMIILTAPPATGSYMRNYVYTVTVGFPPNETDWKKTYIVRVAEDSTIVWSYHDVYIFQSAGGGE